MDSCRGVRFMEASTDIENEEHNLATLLDKATDMVTPFVVPLYEDNKGRPHLFGSGFFVKAGEHSFLVSAAHVLETLRIRPLFYYTTPTITRKLSGQLRLNPWKGDRERDPIDIGVLKLVGNVPPYPEVNKYAMDISYLRPRLLPRADKIYAIVGFPASKHIINPVSNQVTAAAYAYRSRSASDYDYSENGVSPQTHVVLPLDLKQGVDSNGRQRNFPKPQGMSGSPIWVLLEEGEVDSRVFPVVAVGTKYRKTKHALIATDIEVAVRMMMESV